MGCFSPKPGEFKLKETNTINFDQGKQEICCNVLDIIKDEVKSCDFKDFFRQGSPNITASNFNRFTKSTFKPLLYSTEGYAENVREKTQGSDSYKLKVPNESNELNLNLKDSSCPQSMEAISYPVLEIAVSSSKNLQFNDLVKITPNSITSSQGTTMKKLGEKFLFGKTVNSTKQTNDYSFKDDNMGNSQFEVWYSHEKFYVIDNKKGTGLFRRIDDKILVDHEMVVSFCVSHMNLKVEKSLDANEKIVKIRFMTGPYHNSEKSFNSKDIKLIRIGRSRDADVTFKDESVSRIQCTLSFEEGEWMLYNGNLENGCNKPSTNGIW